MVNPLLSILCELFKEIVQKWINRIGFIGLDNAINNKFQRAEFLKNIEGCTLQIFDYGGRDPYANPLTNSDEELLKKFETFNSVAFSYLLKRNIFCRDIWIICWPTYLTIYFQNEKAYDYLEHISINICCKECVSGFSVSWFLQFTNGLINIIHDRIYGAGRTLSSLREIIDCDSNIKEMVNRCPKIISININFLYDRGIYLSRIDLENFVFYKSMDTKRWKLQVNSYGFFQSGLVSALQMDCGY